MSSSLIAIRMIKYPKSSADSSTTVFWLASSGAAKTAGQKLDRSSRLQKSPTKRIANAYYKYVHDDYDSLNTSWLYIDYANRFLQDKAKQVIHCIIPEVYEFNTNPPNWTSVINFHRFHQYWEENPRTPCNHAGPEAHKKFAKHLARLIT